MPPTTFQNTGFDMGALQQLQQSGSGRASSGGGGFDMNALLQQLGIGGTGFWPAVGLQAGGALFGGLADLFAGKSDAQKQAQSVSNLAENRLGQSVLDPDQYMAEYMRSMLPQFNQQANAVSTRLGLDSGAAQGEMMRYQMPIQAGAHADISKFNAQATAGQDQFLMQLMAQLSQYV